ncbi:hypothetical protein V5O48_010004 [Marasmius crinis-equi]|uniref:F-box domain-containing protein n=1 Tax=Marasmius crinis-equi TaxID=585013 RepID=A0ABR3F9I2_9AGAR
MNGTMPTSLCGACQKETSQMHWQPLRQIDTRFLRSEYMLSEVEAHQMANLLEEEELEYRQNEENMGHLQRLMEEMERRKLYLEANMQRRRSTVSALRRVPVEIWEIIFSAFCSSTDSGYACTVDLSRPQPILEAAPLILLQVCARWRAIVSGRRELWSSIRFRFRKIRHKALGVAGKVLMKSAGQPLDLYIQKYADSSQVSTNDHEVCALLGQHLSRCRRIVLDTGTSALVDFVRNQQIDFPSLESFEHAAHCLIADALWGKPRCEAPKLKAVTTHCVYFFATLPCTQLTSLNCSFTLNVTTEFEELFRHVLPMCRQLHSLTLGFKVEPMFSSRGLHPVELPRLRTLAIGCTFMTSQLSSQIISALTTRSLRDFDFQCERANDGWSYSFLVFLERCSALETLSLVSRRSGDFPRTQTLFAVLQRTPNLRRFELVLEKNLDLYHAPSYRDHVNDFLSAFFLSLSQPGLRWTFVPKLEELSVYASHITLDESMANKVVGAALTRSNSSVGGAVASDNSATPLTSVRLVRFQVEPTCQCHDRTMLDASEKFVLESSPAMIQMEELEEVGVQIVIEDIDESPPGLETG